MASGRDEWASWKAQMKRDGKKTFKLVRGAWREKSSSAIKTITSSSDTQDATSEVEATQRHEISHSDADFQYDPLPGEGFVRLLTIMPGDDEEMIQLQLSAVVLDDAFGSYESLSYVWFVCPSPPPSILHITAWSWGYSGRLVRQVTCSSYSWILCTALRFYHL